MYEYTITFYFLEDRDATKYGIKTIKELETILDMYSKNQEVHFAEIRKGAKLIFSLEL